jgi:hypothetical protein
VGGAYVKAAAERSMKLILKAKEALPALSFRLDLADSDL